MNDKLKYERYRELACTSILFAINEFLADKSEEAEDLFIKWVYECVWFDLLPLNREMIIKHILELKKEGVKRIYWADAWKGYKPRLKKWQKEK